MVTGKLSAAGVGAGNAHPFVRAAVQSPVALVTLTRGAKIAFRVETTRTDAYHGLGSGLCGERADRDGQYSAAA